MKVFSKPISSPSRKEKFPPPLMMRFLRSNVGGRSRGISRSRSSPMFLRKKNNNTTVIETTYQEPSSPKVTCIGQVRVRRSSSEQSRRPRTPAKRHRRRFCGCCARKTLFCDHFAHILKPKSISPVWRKWVLFFRFGYCKKVEIRYDSSKMDLNLSGKCKETETEDQDDEDEDEGEESKVNVNSGVLISSSPPKNALVLTRCRSAPYRSSSLANLFWGSQLTPTETIDEIDKEKTLEQQEEEREEERPTSEREASCRDSTAESIMDGESEGNLGSTNEFEESINGRTADEESKIFESSVRPLTLTRCKSEPARTGERLNPEDNFSIQRRLEITEPSSPYACN